MRRRWLAKEVVQTSNMDCGVAGLKCILESYGIASNYEFLRDACKTDINGTSIDRIEDVLTDIGFDCTQVVIPKEQIIYRDNGILPAIAVVNIGQNITHFVVIWRHFGPWLQIVDPAQGRFWIPAKYFVDNQLYIYRDHIQIQQWNLCFKAWERHWFLDQVRIKLGIEESVFKAAMTDSDVQWQPGAKVDAVLRFITHLADQHRKFRGRTAQALFIELIQNLDAQPDHHLWFKIIPQAFWTCRWPDKWYLETLEPQEQDPAQWVNFSGAVLLKIQPSERLNLKLKQPNKSPDQTTTHHTNEPHSEPTDNQVRQALKEPPISPLTNLFNFVRLAGMISPSIACLSALIVAITITLQAIAFKILFEFDNLIGPGALRIQVAMVIFLVILCSAVLNIPLQLTVQRISRQLEDQFRIALYEKLPLLKDEYFSSRLLSDLIERSHSVTAIESIPVIVVNFIQSLTRLLMVFIGLVYLVPGEAPWLWLFLCSCVLMPFIAQTILTQKDLVTRTLAGTLTRHYSNALLGLFTVKVHSGENTILNQQQESLTRWAKASNTQRSSTVRLAFIQDIITYGFAAILIAHIVTSISVNALNILYVYWILQMPLRAENLFTVMQQYPMVKNIILRLQEPLCSAEDPIEQAAQNPPPSTPPKHKGIQIQCNNAAFSVESEQILNDVNINIRPASHIAIVGTSGAGKSTFLSALLGFGQLDSGEVLIDGKPLSPAVIAQLRAESTWLDPQVYLFKNSIIENIVYGCGHAAHMGEVLDDANLWPLIEGLPDSIHTDCGEAGSQLSGGEGQRIRLARALNKPNVRLALLDEPFRGLDRPTRQQLMATVRKKWRDITLICVIHDVSEALQFDEVAVFENGKVVEQGKPQDLIAQKGALNRLLEQETVVAAEWLKSNKWRHVSVSNGQIVEKNSGEK